MIRDIPVNINKHPNTKNEKARRIEGYNLISLAEDFGINLKHSFFKIFFMEFTQ